MLPLGRHFRLDLFLYSPDTLPDSLIRRLLLGPELDFLALLDGIVLVAKVEVGGEEPSTESDNGSDQSCQVKRGESLTVGLDGKVSWFGRSSDGDIGKDLCSGGGIVVVAKVLFELGGDTLVPHRSGDGGSDGSTKLSPQSEDGDGNG